MELQHRFTVPASLETTWESFNDVEYIAPCFPGASLTSVEGDEFKGTVKVKLGPISMQYRGDAQFVERDESQRRAVIEAKGKDKRGNGTASARVVAQLTADGEGTAVQVDTDLTVTGKPAQFGRGVMQDVSDKLLDQFVECIAGKLGAPPAEEGAPAAGAPAEGAATAGGPSGTESAAPTAGTGAAGPAAASAGTGAAGPAAAGAAPPTGGPPTGGTATERDDSTELNLMSTVVPVLVRRYAAPVAAAVVIAFVGWRLLRRRRRRRSVPFRRVVS